MNPSIAEELREELLRLGAIHYVPSNKGFFIIKLPGEYLTSGQKVGELIWQEHCPTIRGPKPISRLIRKHECIIYDEGNEAILSRKLQTQEIDAYLKKYRKQIDDSPEFLISGLFKGKTKLVDITKNLEPGTAVIDASKGDGHPVMYCAPIPGTTDKFKSFTIINPNKDNVNGCLFSQVERLIPKDGFKIHSPKYFKPINDLLRKIGLLEEKRGTGKGLDETTVAVMDFIKEKINENKGKKEKLVPSKLKTEYDKHLRKRFTPVEEEYELSGDKGKEAEEKIKRYQRDIETIRRILKNLMKK